MGRSRKGGKAKNKQRSPGCHKHFSIGDNRNDIRVATGVWPITRDPAKKGCKLSTVCRGRESVENDSIVSNGRGRMCDGPNYAGPRLGAVGRNHREGSAI